MPIRCIVDRNAEVIDVFNALADTKGEDSREAADMPVSFHVVHR